MHMNKAVSVYYSQLTIHFLLGICTRVKWNRRKQRYDCWRQLTMSFPPQVHLETKSASQMFEVLRRNLAHTDSYPHLLSALQHCLLLPCKVHRPQVHRSEPSQHSGLGFQSGSVCLQTNRPAPPGTTGSCWTGSFSSWFCRQTRAKTPTWRHWRISTLGTLYQCKFRV